MTSRRCVTTLLIAGASAYVLLSLVVAGAARAAGECGAAQSSAASAYGGQGTQITQGCPSGSTLPFTGLDLGLLVAAGAVLVLAGIVIRWRLRPGEG